jgi:hypothetical protein
MSTSIPSTSSTRRSGSKRRWGRFWPPVRCRRASEAITRFRSRSSARSPGHTGPWRWCISTATRTCGRSTSATGTSTGRPSEGRWKRASTCRAIQSRLASAGPCIHPRISSSERPMGSRLSAPRRFITTGSKRREGSSIACGAGKRTSRSTLTWWIRRLRPEPARRRWADSRVPTSWIFSACSSAWRSWDSTSWKSRLRTIRAGLPRCSPRTSSSS